MNKITTSTVTTFTLSDGRTFATRAEAVAAQDHADRVARMVAANFSVDFAGQAADHAKELIAALTLPAKMGPKPKVKAVAAAQA